jgi:hypothetical protein
VIHFFSSTGRKEMNKSTIATMLYSSNAALVQNKNIIQKEIHNYKTIFLLLE